MPLWNFTFYKPWSFNQITSSPCYPQSNSKAEHAVKIVKRFAKCLESGQKEYLAFLDCCDTPSEGQFSTTIPRALLKNPTTILWTTPTTSLLYMRRYVGTDQKEWQGHYYDQHAKLLKPIASGDTIWMHLPGQTTCTAATCTDTVGPRSYTVKMRESVFRHNRRRLIHSDNLPLQDYPMVEPVPQLQYHC